MITNNGMKIAINRIIKATPDYTVISKFKLGIDQATLTVTDTDITQPIPITNTELCDNCETIANWTSTTDGTDSLNTTTYKEGAGALNLIKAATTVGNVTYYNNNSMTNRDFTAKDLWVWIYIKNAATLAKLATADCLELRYGNDYDTNFYYRKYSKAALAVGWNYLIMNTTTGTETGTVTLASCDSGALKFTFTATSDTIAEGDIILDDWKLSSSTDYEKAFEASYPTIDETNFEAQYKGYITVAMANGYNLTGIGTFNTDTTNKMQDVWKYSAVSKSKTDEIIFYLTNRITRR